MSFSELKLSGFLDLLASGAPAPGGGAAAALVGCMGCALIEMVANLTIGKPKYAEYEGIMSEILSSALKLRQELSDAADKDAEAFRLVSAAYKMPKDTQEQREQRKKAIEESLKTAAAAPMALLELTRDTILLCERAVGRSNPNVVSDLEVAAVLLKSAAKGARINVLVNLDGIEDESFNEALCSESERLLDEISLSADRIAEGRFKK